ncbi:hypothetical protein ACFSKU_15580 [Pontibacter silvestris]|uniref:Metallo-beta-lactamase domain-containing protein n=1 Tax=Pontibacter silvestris TaxID=2305183 RepID=A0ABW4X161_9BACT|nr:hypothetical protein [Pontibacter silvestris]MCC9137547.1 hypothetical protein [Pontibacter silvestris]
MHLDSTLQLMAMHVHNAHTDGDAMILHTGDVFFNGRYPFIDLNSGGTIDGTIKAVNSALFIVNKDTKIIPGHGEVANGDDLMRYRDLLMTIRERVKNAKDSGKTLEQVQSMGLTKEWDKAQGQGKTKPRDMVESVYNSLD